MKISKTLGRGKQRTVVTVERMTLAHVADHIVTVTLVPVTAQCAVDTHVLYGDAALALIRRRLALCPIGVAVAEL